ncbi:hypothetical protein LXD69_12630 [Flavobacterium sediminilitoris]|uniref:Uncharacterized protein n=1 Tax=Flavobacterium sediminilitoris TaxID=2024526 RepID=A0ABY4HJ69_9FLAO|nr:MULTISPECIES: hypothetical protein [Flavobacterium]UOX32879.1 hypothetical protein LXD69_12630 [Flavobacterium sediminilitoris]
MKKIIVLLLITQSIFAQKLSKEELIKKISDQTCQCSQEKNINKDNLDITLGLCIIESINKFEKDVEKHFGKDILGNEEKMTEIAESVGMQLAFNCPSFLKLINEMEEENIGSDDFQDDLSISGKIIATKSEQFLTFTLKEDSGKTNSFLILENFENLFLLKDAVVKPTDNVKVLYYEANLYDAKSNKVVPFKVVLDIIKQ